MRTNERSITVRYHEHGILTKVQSNRTRQTREGWHFKSADRNETYYDTELIEVLNFLSEDGYELVCLAAGRDCSYLLRSIESKRRMVAAGEHKSDPGPSIASDDNQVAVKGRGAGLKEGLRPTLTVAEACEYLNIGQTKMHLLIKSGEIRSYKNGGLRRIKREDLLEFERSLTEP
ncbi:helix-turn-helix domain-containing protein [Gorillibacterium timonense]|uniref:helix-turn-helix domain-containing protein n=1 Tax=Gorillibacterium timonense TaxID=1689269 RepID=UPI00071D6F91|nr:helix-turn-helix domain-containing protein [Gorillibacterium timonense]